MRKGGSTLSHNLPALHAHRNATKKSSSKKQSHSDAYSYGIGPSLGEIITGTAVVILAVITVLLLAYYIDLRFF